MLDNLHQLMFFGGCPLKGLLRDDVTDSRWVCDIGEFECALLNATQSDGATILDCSGTDSNECRLAARHQPLVGKPTDMVIVVTVNVPHERAALLACAHQSVLMLVVLYDTNNEAILETQAQLCYWQLQKGRHFIKQRVL